MWWHVRKIRYFGSLDGWSPFIGCRLLFDVMYANTKGHFSTHNVYPFTFNEWAIRSTSACHASHRNRTTRKESTSSSKGRSFATQLPIICAITWSFLTVQLGNVLTVTWRVLLCLSVLDIHVVICLNPNSIELERTEELDLDNWIQRKYHWKHTFAFIIPKQLHNCVYRVENRHFRSEKYPNR